MTLRSPHGRAASLGSGPRIETLPADEQPFAEAGVAAPITAGRDRSGKVRTAEAARAMAQLPRRGAFVPRKLACDPHFEPHNRRRLEWLKARRLELAASTGGVSHGVGAMLASAAWLYAGGEFAAERAAETADVELFKVAASLTSTARQHDLAAWELATREGQARRQRADAAPPWLEAPADAPKAAT
jgi:hypothetical protein